MSAGGLFPGRLIMAPMSRGTDLPYRRLLAEWGCEIAVGEMAYAHKIVRRDPREMPLIRRHDDERVFGVQLAGKDPETMAEAARIAVGEGADFVDVNLGCPIDEATRRGFGAALLRRATRVAAIVEAIKAAVDVPVTIKLRLGWSSEKPTYLKIALAAENAGVDAVILHARSRAQRYRRPADWSHVRTLAEAVRVPVIGNGDVVGPRDARRRLAETGCAAVMIGRWGLSKPWVFREWIDGRALDADEDVRVGVLRRYVELCRELHGDDERGLRRVRRFLAFHQDFFARYRRGMADDAARSDDPRDRGEPAASPLEAWLCRTDVAGVEALVAWLVDGAPAEPPPPPGPDARRAVKVAASG